MDPYRVLELTPPVTRDQARAAYHRLVRARHPDVAAVGRGEAARRDAEEAMKMLNAAYREVLLDIARSPGGPRRAPPPPPPASASRPPVCGAHGADRVYRCARCGAACCARCLKARRCPACPDPARPREGWGWIAGLIGGLAAMHELQWPAPEVLGGIAVYLGAMGVGVLRRQRGAGLLLWLLFPYSLVLAGLWRLGSMLSGPRRS
jgi:hypothetical protein